MSDEAAAPKDESSPAQGRPVGRPPLLDEQDLQILMELVLAEPSATIRRLQQRMEEQCGRRPSRGVVRDAVALQARALVGSGLARVCLGAGVAVAAGYAVGGVGALEFAGL